VSNYDHTPVSGTKWPKKTTKCIVRKG